MSFRVAAAVFAGLVGGFILGLAILVAARQPRQPEPNAMPRIPVVVTGSFDNEQLNEKLRNYFACEPVSIAAMPGGVVVLLSCPIEGLPRR